MQAENVLRADYDFTDEPLETSEIDGLDEAIEHVDQSGESVIVECDDRVSDYKVYWNENTDSVRIGALVIKASYEVGGEQLEKPRLGDFDE